MRFYKGAHEYLHTVSQLRNTFDQCLYLVPEMDNKHDVNAVMLHNGKKKLASVNATDSAKIKAMLARWKDENGGGRNEDVIVCRIPDKYMDAKSYCQLGSIQVYGMQRVNERLARKFSDKQRKEVYYG